MRVALFTDTYLPQINGVTNTLKKLIQYFKETGVAYKVFAPQYEDEKRDYHIEHFYSIKFFLYPETRIAFPNSQRLASALKDFSPDIIHIMTEMNMGLAGLRLGKKYHIPTISNYTTNFSQYTPYYNLNFLKQPVWSYLKWFHLQNDMTLCPSHAAQRLLALHEVTNTGIFSRGIDTEAFRPDFRSRELRKQLELENKTVFLYVGRVSAEKDLDILCKSYQKIKENYPEQAALIITGDGPALEDCKKNFPDDTVFTGFKTGMELAVMYASCDIFVCPSSTETFGNVILEAMASGAPVIGADALGVGEIIDHGTNGIKFEPRNYEELYQCMERLLLSDSLQKQLSRNGLIYAGLKTWEHEFENLLAAYSTVIRSYFTSDMQKQK